MTMISFREMTSHKPLPTFRLLESLFDKVLDFVV
jgi:hypothetical protein